MAVSFQVGDPVFHPIHGAGSIRELSTRVILDEEKQYYVIELPNNELHEVMVPVDKADSVGLRAINPKEKIDEILKILRNEEKPADDAMVKSFYQRYREYVAQVQSGDVGEVALVYKLLHLRNAVKPLGMKDKNLLEMAEHLLVSEMTFALGIPREEVLEEMSSCLKESLSFIIDPEEIAGSKEPDKSGKSGKSDSKKAAVEKSTEKEI